jgi:hypothetical protein
MGIFSVCRLGRNRHGLDKSSNRGLFRAVGRNNFQNIGLFLLATCPYRWPAAVPSLIRAPASPASGGAVFLRVA